MLTTPPPMPKAAPPSVPKDVFVSNLRTYPYSLPPALFKHVLEELMGEPLGEPLVHGTSFYLFNILCCIQPSGTRMRSTPDLQNSTY